MLNQTPAKSVMGFGRGCRHLPSLVFAYRFSFNKRVSMRRFAPESALRFVSDVNRIPPGSTVLLWGSAALAHELSRRFDVVRVEDGFLRSVWLGAEFAQPLSWVMDGRGVHYDPRQPSDLEDLLQTKKWSGPLLARAASLRKRIVASGITKYSVGHAKWRRPSGVARVILIPGQVESDASLRLGAPGLHTNVGLLRAVRQACPDAYLVYKPHPDVSAGLRAKGPDEANAKDHCDSVVTDVDMAELLMQVDEIHVLTSLTGFEALLRRKTVVCYGLPFYAGWGLTRDVLPITRRTRRLTLDQLVAGSLIDYPRYIARADGKSTSPERALDDLTAWRAQSPKQISTWRDIWRGAIRFSVGVA
jgi:capsular polysaccharide export protein